MKALDRNKNSEKKKTETEAEARTSVRQAVEASLNIDESRLA